VDSERRAVLLHKARWARSQRVRLENAARMGCPLVRSFGMKFLRWLYAWYIVHLTPDAKPRDKRRPTLIRSNSIAS